MGSNLTRSRSGSTLSEGFPEQLIQKATQDSRPALQVPGPDIRGDGIRMKYACAAAAFGALCKRMPACSCLPQFPLKFCQLPAWQP